MMKNNGMAKKIGNSQNFWNNFAGTFDILTSYSEWRWGAAKKNIFSNAHGKILMVGAGTGRDFPFFPENADITAIDFSINMINIARERLNRSPARLSLQYGDVQALSFPDESFDSCITSCVFCSVEDPKKGLLEILRVLKPEGKMLMFEHTGSRNKFFNAILHCMNILPGPDFTRNTVNTVKESGFDVVDIQYVFQDIVKIIEATKVVNKTKELS